MVNNTKSYQNLSQYLEDIISLTKASFARYLKLITREGADSSLQQHLFQETLLRKEVECFLGSCDNVEDSILEFDERILEKADYSMKEGLFLPLEYLCRIFGLNRFERFIVTVLAASGMDTNFDKVYTFLGNDVRSSRLSLELATRMYYRTDFSTEEMNSSLSEVSKLGRFFLSFDKNYNTHRLKRMLGLKPVIEAFLYKDEPMSGEVSRVTEYFSSQEELDPILLKDKPYLHMLSYLSGLKQDKATLFYLYGVGGIGKKLNIKHLARKTNQSVMFLKLEKLVAYSKDMNSEGSLYSILQSVLTEVIIRQSILCICSNAVLPEEDEDLLGLIQTILDFVKEDLPVIFLTSDCAKKLHLTLDNLDVITIETKAGDLEEFHHFWIEMAKGYYFAPEVNLEAFANKFILTPGQIKEIYEEAGKLSRWYGQASISLQLLQRVCFDKIEHNLGKKAQKVKMVYQWEDLILPDYQKNLLTVACNQIKYKYKVFSEWGYDEKMAYGTGLSLIFSGSPGTGKTMAAQIFARELGLELYKIELASVVSKYIGETERNLSEIFEEARKSQAIIFFDEADVLFSKRSEVKDSNDKYSNMEAAFMLQKIEEYTGIVILATNYQQNIDEAFKRRIKFLIDFPFPDKEYRKKLWKKVFPEKLPLSGDVDYDFLSDHFELTGSNIRNVALNAAFLAASADSEVGMAHIITSVVNEFTKSGKKLSREDLGEYYMYA